MFPNYIRRIAAKPCILNVNRGKWLRSARKTNSGGNIINEGQGDDRAGEDDFARYGEAGPPPRQGRSRGGHGRVCMVEFREMAKEQAEAARAGTKRPSRSASTTRAPWRPIRRTIGPQPSPRARGMPGSRKNHYRYLSECHYSPKCPHGRAIGPGRLGRPARGAN